MRIERHDFLESNEPFTEIALLIEAISQFFDTYDQLYMLITFGSKYNINNWLTLAMLKIFRGLKFVTF